MRRLSSVLKEGWHDPPPAPLGAAAGIPGVCTKMQGIPLGARIRGGSPVQMAQLKYCGQSCRFSPFTEDLLVVATSQLFGMAGPGALEVFTLQNINSAAVAASPGAAATAPPPILSPADIQASPAEILQPQRRAFIHHKESVNDVAWSELNAHILVGGGGGKVISIWKLLNEYSAVPASGLPPGGSPRGPPDFGAVPVGELKGHIKDIISLSWSCVDKRMLASSGLDGRVWVWDMQQHGAAVKVLQHSAGAAAGSCCCSTSPVDAALIASAGADGRIAVHDLRVAVGSTSRSQQITAAATAAAAVAWSVQAHPCEVLCVDWMKHRSWQLLSGAADGTVALWDLRKSTKTDCAAAVTAEAAAAAAATCRLSSTQAHQLAVRRVASHPFNARRFASCSYDMQVKIWDSDASTSSSSSSSGYAAAAFARPVSPSPFIEGSGWVRLQTCYDHHREFVLGLDWSTFKNGVIASASWDRSVCIWNTDTGAAPPLVPKRPLFFNVKNMNKT